jgi:GNAT superfamily N-acetyltransferase
MIAVRRAEIEEAEAVARVINAAFRPAEEFFVEGDRIRVEGVRELCAKGAFLVAGDFAGVIYAELRGERAYFGLLSVDPSQQGAGIGRALVAAAEDLARAHGCRYMDIKVVNLRTELPPRYEKLGYTHAGTEPWLAGVPCKLPCHFLLMEKAL